jgi:hypothetical protein
MDFFAYPTSTTITPLSPTTSVIVEDIITPIIPARSFVSTTLNFPRAVTRFGLSTIFQPSSAFYYDSGIGENPIAQHETNEDLRYEFLDKWIYDDFPEILRMLKVQGDTVKVLSASEAKNNDISKDSEKDLEKKSDFIGSEILTLSKSRKVLQAFVDKHSHIKWYDLPHNKHYVKKEQGKYVKRKLEEMQSGK